MRRKIHWLSQTRKSLTRAEVRYHRRTGQSTFCSKCQGSRLAVNAAGPQSEKDCNFAQRRELTKLGEDLITCVLNAREHVDVVELIQLVQAQLYSFAESHSANQEAQSFHFVAMNAIKLAEQRAITRDQSGGRTTGLVSLDDKIGGLKDGQLTILVGQSSIYNAALATTIAFNTSNQLRHDVAQRGNPTDSEGTAVGYFSLNMSADRLVSIIFAQQASLNCDDLLMGRMTPEHLGDVDRVIQGLNHLPLFIDDNATLSV